MFVALCTNAVPFTQCVLPINKGLLCGEKNLIYYFLIVSMIFPETLSLFTDKNYPTFNSYFRDILLWYFPFPLMHIKMNALLPPNYK